MCMVCGELGKQAVAAKHIPEEDRDTCPIRIERRAKGRRVFTWVYEASAEAEAS